VARVLRQSRASVGEYLTLGAIVGGAWAVTASRMQGMDMGPGTDLGGPGWFAVVWATMMAAMMLPSLSPMAVACSRDAGRGKAHSIARTVVFAAGYLLVWLAAGALASVLVEGVHSLDPGFLVWDRAGRNVADGVILAAAIYELTTAKGRCLRHCRDARLLRRTGAAGALTMGMEQGAFCVGCSGALMAALFALGVMSIAWMLLISVEKFLPWSAIAIGTTAAALALLGTAVVLAPDRVPWLTIPVSM